MANAYLEELKKRKKSDSGPGTAGAYRTSAQSKRKGKVAAPSRPAPKSRGRNYTTAAEELLRKKKRMGGPDTASAYRSQSSKSRSSRKALKASGPAVGKGAPAGKGGKGKGK